MTWTPRAIIGTWTPDQQRIAENFPEARRLCCVAANGVGKTYLAADLAVSFMLDFTAALVITTAPTQRQVEQLLWPEIWNRLKQLELVDPQAERGPPEWSSPDGDRYIGFATNRPARMQGLHAGAMLIIIDEASGMTQALIEACEALAVGEQNFIFAIGNPNEPSGPFFALTKTPSWRQEQLSALTHPNIVTRTEIIPGATNWRSLLARVKDWCRKTDTQNAESFALDLTEAEADYLVSDLPEPPHHDFLASRTVSHFLPNDAFRIRYLGDFPESASGSLFSGPQLLKCLDRAVTAEGRKFASVDVAREGGDNTIYALRQGNAITALEVIPASEFLAQADEIVRRIHRDNPESLTIECAGLGTGLHDLLTAVSPCRVFEFPPAGDPPSPQDQKRFANRRAQGYGNLATAVQQQQISLPNDPDLIADLQATLYKYTPEQQLQILDKATIKAKTGRSPDRADAVSILWEYGSYYTPTTQPRRSHKEEIDW